MKALYCIIATSRMRNSSRKNSRTAKKWRPLERLRVVARHTRWLRAARSGIHRIEVELGQRVRRGDRLGVIPDPFGAVEDEVRSEPDGIVIGQTSLPLVNEGDALFHLARFDRLSAAERTAEGKKNLIDNADNQLPDTEPPTY